MKRMRALFVLLIFSVFFFALSGLSEGAECPLDGQQHYWKLEEQVAPYVDAAGGGNLTCTNCPDSLAGKVGNAQKFNGTDDAASVAGERVNWANGDSFSIEIWVKLDGACSGTQVFIGRDEPGTGTPLQWWVGCSAGFAKFKVKDSAGDDPGSLTSTKSIADGNWHHIVAERDAAVKRLRLYVDGVQDGYISNTIFLGNFSGTAPLVAGNLAEGAGYALSGSLDEVSVYNKVLTAEEVAAHYNGGAGLSYCGESEPPPVENNPPHVPQLVSAVVNADKTVTFTWKKCDDPDPGDGISNYEIYFSQNEDYSDCEPIKVDASGQILAYAGVGGFGAGFLLFGLALAGRIRSRRRIYILIGVLLIASAMLVSCGGGGGSDSNTPPPGTDISVQTSAPLASGTYYWKVEAYDTKGASSETEGIPFEVLP